MATQTNEVTNMAVEAQKKVARLEKIGKNLSAIRAKIAALNAQEAEVMAQAEAVAAGKSVGKKVGRPAKAKPAAKPKRKAKTVAKAKKTGKVGRPAKKASRASSDTGESLQSVLMNILPAHDAEGIDRSTLAKLVESRGYHTTAQDPCIVIGQNLTTMSKGGLAEAAVRGQWRLTKKGEKALSAAAEEAAKVDESAAA
jgi:hypothetical protein